MHPKRVMPDFNQDNIETILETCRENSAAIAESLNQCIDSNYRIEIGEFLPWSSGGLSPAFDGPGLTVGFAVAGQGVFCLIPESLPLPDWYTHPGDSEDSRLQTLAIEWPMNMLPMEFEAEKFRTLAVDNLKAVIVEAEPLEWSVVLELLLFHEDDPATQTTELPSESESSTDADADADATASESESSATEPSATNQESAENSAVSDEKETEQTSRPEQGQQEPRATILMVWPVSRLDFFSQATSAEEDAAPASPAESDSGASASAAQTPAASSDPPTQMQHLLNMPVKVMVCLAEKRMQMETLLTLTPGSLITFNKSCEDLLDLYVNNHLYCRGEAIKIDEKFGLKINEVDVIAEKKESWLGM